MARGQKFDAEYHLAIVDVILSQANAFADESKDLCPSQLDALTTIKERLHETMCARVVEPTLRSSAIRLLSSDLSAVTEVIPPKT
jgi:hypothetical protein